MPTPLRGNLYRGGHHLGRILDEVSKEKSAPLDRLRLYVRRQVAYSLDNVERVAVYHHDLERLGDERRQDIVGRRRAHEDFVAGLIAEAQADGDADADENARVLTRLVFGTMILTYDWFRPGRDDPERSVVASSQMDALKKILGELPEDLRVVWVLREVGGHSYDEIAVEVGESAATVRGRLARARKTVLERMEEWR